MAPNPRVRPYKDFLTPALHRRFVTATAYIFLLSYVEAVLIGEWNSLLWSWFPLGRAGIRTGLIFIPGFMIFILRVAQLHAGLRTSYSGWETFKSYLGKFHVIQTAGWYLLSAYLFSEVYVWSVPKYADLNRIKVIHKTDRTTLNEKPIYLTSYFFFLALVQALSHLYLDFDRIETPVEKGLDSTSEKDAHAAISARAKVSAAIFSLAGRSLRRVILVAAVSPFVYFLPLGIYPYSIRSFAWGFTRSWAKIFWNLPKSGSPPAIGPFHWDVLLRSVTAGFLLTMLWDVSNTAFSAYVAQPPLKNGRPVTYESRDPNGSLLTGLKGKKLQTRVFAFWELVFISRALEGRRKLMFEDIDRKGGSMWSQTLAACLEVINGIGERITEYETPVSKEVPEEKKDEIKPLPRLTKPLKDSLSSPGDLFDSPKPGRTGGATVGNVLKSIGQSPPNQLSPRAKRLLQRKEDSILTPEQRVFVSTASWIGQSKEWVTKFLKSPVGKPFRQEYRRIVAAIVLGSPHGDVGIIVDAIDSLTRLAVCSLREDKYGNVQRDVKLIIQTFTTTVTKLEAFKKDLGLHWTDVERVRESPETETVLLALKGGLNELVNAFGNYSDDLRLSQSEMRMAREAAGPPPAAPQMAERR